MRAAGWISIPVAARVTLARTRGNDDRGRVDVWQTRWLRSACTPGPVDDFSGADLRAAGSRSRAAVLADLPRETPTALSPLTPAPRPRASRASSRPLRERRARGRELRSSPGGRRRPEIGGAAGGIHCPPDAVVGGADEHDVVALHDRRRVLSVRRDRVALDLYLRVQKAELGREVSALPRPTSGG